ncbi:conserved hypothetical protein [Microsporum canis CBS 113480]|uniref:Uncharacterized protein n=1 Tax=Arthroderma otae (strain ATCC MYA-4605 / CBS 113480) TaxID=554155 RepID=C5FIP8_ARTOC|nr:conserved hypothetical protein [Microsporum canis CBS 113480]EEQ29139.1 conserved hypothetical protein [Microsporum canis CBS 113480]
MADDQSGQLVKNAVEIQRRMDYGNGPGDLPKMADIAVAQIKASAMFAHPWQQLLGSAPVAINSTGLAFIAAASDTAATIELDPPRGGFQYLHLPQVNDIMMIIINPDDAQRMLKGSLMSIKKSADDCYERAKTIDKGFNDWMLYATELYTCCIQKESTAEEKLAATKIQMLVAQNILKADEINVKTQKANTKVFQKQLKMASDVYKKASDSFPSGWDLVGQELVGKLGDVLVTALGQLASSYAENMNATAKAAEAERLFKDFNGKGDKDGNKNTTLPTPEPKAKVPLPQNSNDPAYVRIKPTIVFLRGVNTVLTGGKDGGVNWEEVSTVTSSGSKSLLFNLQMLKDARQQFVGVATEEEPSVQLKGILQTAIQIADEVYKLGGKSKIEELPGPDDKQVKQWQSGFKEVYDQANQLYAVSQSLPGSTSTETIMANPDKQSAPDPQMAQGKALLEAAKDRLHTTQQAYIASSKAYQDATKALAKDQKDLADAQNNLLKLNTDEKSLVIPRFPIPSHTYRENTAVKQILEASIRLIAVVKTRVMDLVTFFNSISLTIEVIVDEVVEDFVRQIKENVANNDPDGELSDLKIGKYNLTDLARTHIYKSAIFMRANFEVFGEVAKMWSDLSVENIMPGVRLLNDISAGVAEKGSKDPVGSRDEVNSKVKQLRDWYAAAQGNIEKLAGDEQQKILSGMDERIQQVAKDTTVLPPPDDSTKSAINAGAEEVSDAAHKALKFNSENNPMAVWVKKTASG